ncbi:MAG: DUF1738 domain-containing protein [Alphaproteobacteria bacterium]|nr:DUF1738 domain-containing protein [Alphaproteobacteria bacterium]MBO7642257.1 DUF1738 domain-containing protein [Alphaproteobacteria bacterium]
MSNIYEDPRYCTFNQAKAKGWKIKLGEYPMSTESNNL